MRLSLNAKRNTAFVIFGVFVVALKLLHMNGVMP